MLTLLFYSSCITTINVNNHVNMQCIHVVTHVEQSQLLMSQFKNRPQNVGTTDTA